MKSLSLDFDLKRNYNKSKLNICNEEKRLETKSNNFFENHFNNDIDKNIIEFIVENIMENNYYNYTKTRRKILEYLNKSSVSFSEKDRYRFILVNDEKEIDNISKVFVLKLKNGARLSEIKKIISSFTSIPKILYNKEYIWFYVKNDFLITKSFISFAEKYHHPFKEKSEKNLEVVIGKYFVFEVKNEKIISRFLEVENSLRSYLTMKEFGIKEPLFFLSMKADFYNSHRILKKEYARLGKEEFNKELIENYNEYFKKENI